MNFSLKQDLLRVKINSIVSNSMIFSLIFFFFILLLSNRFNHCHTSQWSAKDIFFVSFCFLIFFIFYEVVWSLFKVIFDARVMQMLWITMKIIPKKNKWKFENRFYYSLNFKLSFLTIRKCMNNFLLFEMYSNIEQWTTWFKSNSIALCIRYVNQISSSNTFVSSLHFHQFITISIIKCFNKIWIKREREKNGKHVLIIMFDIPYFNNNKKCTFIGKLNNFCRHNQLCCTRICVMCGDG